MFLVYNGVLRSITWSKCTQIRPEGKSCKWLAG